jgi:hypothetical protein
MTVCPCCGYCPHCGRKNYSYPYQYPYTWCGTTLGGLAGSAQAQGGMTNLNQETVSGQSWGQQSYQQCGADYQNCGGTGTNCCASQ